MLGPITLTSSFSTAAETKKTVCLKNTDGKISPTHYLFLDFIYCDGMEDAKKSAIYDCFIGKLKQGKFAVSFSPGDTIEIAWVVEEFGKHTTIWTISRLDSMYVKFLADGMLKHLVTTVHRELGLKTEGFSLGVMVHKASEVTVIGTLKP